MTAKFTPLIECPYYGPTYIQDAINIRNVNIYVKPVKRIDFSVVIKDIYCIFEVFNILLIYELALKLYLSKFFQTNFTKCGQFLHSLGNPTIK